MESTPQNNQCPTCKVPISNHGTCCGWENASVRVDKDLTIIDQGHPGFGKNLMTWKNDILAKLN